MSKKHIVNWLKENTNIIRVLDWLFWRIVLFLYLTFMGVLGPVYLIVLIFFKRNWLKPIIEKTMDKINDNLIRTEIKD